MCKHGIIMTTQFSDSNLPTNIIIYHDFLPPPRKDSNDKSDNTHTIIQYTLLAQILDTCALIFSSWVQSPHVTASHPSEGGNYRSTGEWSEIKQGRVKMAAWNSFSYICTRALHSFLSFAHCPAASIVIPLLPKATFTPSIQPTLGLSHTRPPLTSAINTLLAIRYSSILSTAQTISILSDPHYSLAPFLFHAALQQTGSTKSPSFQRILIIPNI